MADIDFALGLIAGEGSFTLSQKTYDTEKKYCLPQFHITLSLEDSYLVCEVREVFGGIGSISEHERPGSDDDIIMWSVSSKKDLKKMVEIIEENSYGSWLASQKYEAFKTWKKIVEINYGGDNTDENRVNMAYVAQEESLNVGAGGTDANWNEFLDWYAENRNIYPSIELRDK